MQWLKRLRGKFRKRDVDRRQIPSRMMDLKGGDPCWCGSARKYKHCHRADDRRRLREACRGIMPFSRNPFI